MVGEEGVRGSGVHPHPRAGPARAWCPRQQHVKPVLPGSSRTAHDTHRTLRPEPATSIAMP